MHCRSTENFWTKNDLWGTDEILRAGYHIFVKTSNSSLHYRSSKIFWIEGDPGVNVGIFGFRCHICIRMSNLSYEECLWCIVDSPKTFELKVILDALMGGILKFGCHMSKNISNFTYREGLLAISFWVILALSPFFLWKINKLRKILSLRLSKNFSTTPS